MLILLEKSFVASHQRRLKSGEMITIDAHYDKRTKKHALHAPIHNHSIDHLSDDDKGKFNRMHAEQHQAHYYESHALGRKLEAEKQLLATLERSAKRHEANGDKKSMTAVHNKIIKLKQRIMRYEKLHHRTKSVVEGIGKFKNSLVAGSGELKDDTDKMHAHYVSKMGERFKERKTPVGAVKAHERKNGAEKKESWQLSLDEYKAANPDIRERSAKNRWAGDVSDAWTAGNDVSKKVMDELKSVNPGFIPDDLASDDVLLDRLKDKITDHIESEISRQKLAYKKELTTVKSKGTKERLGLVEADQKYGAKLHEIKKVIDDLDDEHWQRGLGNTSGKYAKEVVAKYRDMKKEQRNKKSSELIDQKKDNTKASSFEPTHELSDGEPAKQAAEAKSSGAKSELELNKEYHPAIVSFANDLVEGGGITYTYDEHGKINGRTQSVNPSWFKDGAFIVLSKKGDPLTKTPTVKEIKQAVGDYAAGNKTTDKQKRILSALSDIATAEEEFQNQGYEGEQLDFTNQIAALLFAAKGFDDEHFNALKHLANNDKITNDNIHEFWGELNELIEEDTKRISKDGGKSGGGNNSQEGERGSHSEKDIAGKDSEKSKIAPSVDDSPKEGDRNAEGLVFRDGRWHRDGEEAKADKQEKIDDLNPNSQNYRYRDTGDISGSNAVRRIICRVDSPLGNPPQLRQAVIGVVH